MDIAVLAQVLSSLGVKRRRVRDKAAALGLGGAGLGPVVIDPDAGEGSALKKGRAAPEANVGDEGDRQPLPQHYRVARSQKRGTPRRLRPSRGAESAGA